MFDEWNQKWKEYVAKEKCRWEIHLPDQLCLFLSQISFCDACYETYDLYDHYSFDFTVNDDTYGIIIETKFPVVSDWSLSKNDVYYKMKDFFGLSSVEFQYLMKIFTRFSIYKMIYDLGSFERRYFRTK